MPHSRANSASSILTILSCDSDRFSEFYNGGITTADLVRDAKRIISHNRELLRKSSQDRYRLDELLLGMLDDAPDPSGTRYVAVVLHIANDKGSDAVVEAAKAWLDYLYFPMLTLSKATKTVPSSSQTPTYDDTAVEVGNATRSDQAGLRAAVAVREQYRCAITNYVDLARVTYLVGRGRGNEVPDTELPQVHMEAAHIIPFSLNKFDESKDLKDAVYTWDMLRAWTGVDVRQLVGSKINSPENCVYMNDADHSKFGRFLFYFEKYPGLPNKYKVEMAQPRYRLGNGKVTADVEFSENAGVMPPSPQFLNIHAAFAKVLARSEAAIYMERVEIGNQRGAPTSSNEGNDFAMLLRSKLLASAP